jgi:hypothetical protein
MCGTSLEPGLPELPWAQEEAAGQSSMAAICFWPAISLALTIQSREGTSHHRPQAQQKAADELGAAGYLASANKLVSLRLEDLGAIPHAKMHAPFSSAALSRCPAP